MENVVKKFVILSALSCSALVAVPAAAAPIIVDYSFNSFVGSAGTVSGKLVFDKAGSGVAAAEAYVLSAPSGVLTGSVTSDNFALGDVTTNSFDVSPDGTVTGADFEAFNQEHTYFLNLNASRNGNGTFISQQQAPYQFALTFGFSSITFTPEAAPAPVAGAVPEPATWAMMLLGFGMLGAGLRYRRQSTSAKVSLA